MTAGEYLQYLIEQERRGCVDMKDGEPCEQCSPCRAKRELNIMAKEDEIEFSGVSEDEARGKR